VAGIYTLTNYGQRINCSVSILFPQSFALQSMAIGTTNAQIDFDNAARGVVKHVSRIILQKYQDGLVKMLSISR